jgi:hypothetical protein
MLLPVPDKCLPFRLMNPDGRIPEQLGHHHLARALGGRYDARLARYDDFQKRNTVGFGHAALRRIP